MKDEVRFQVDILASVTADLDVSDSQVFEAISNILEKLVGYPELEHEVFQAEIGAAQEALENLMAFPGEFAAHYGALSGAVDSLQRKIECGMDASAEPAEAPAPEIEASSGDADDVRMAEMADADIQELDVQLDVLGELLAELDGRNNHVTEVSATIFEKITCVATLPEAFKQSARAAAALLGRLKAGEAEISEASTVCRDAVRRMKSALGSDDTLSGRATAKEQAFDDLLLDDDELRARLIEQQLQLLQKFESDVLGIECEGAARDIRRCAARLPSDVEELDAPELTDFARRFAAAVEPMSDAPPTETVNALLAAKDLLSDYLTRMMDGAAPEFDSAHGAGIIAAIVGAEEKPRHAQTPASKIMNEEKHVAKKSKIEVTASEIQEFVTETREYLHDAEVAMMTLEKSPGDTAALNEVFRCFHNVKGITGFMNLKDVNQLAHNAESLLDRARRGDISFSAAVAGASFKALDMLKEMVDAINSAADGEYETPAGLERLVLRLQNPENHKTEEAKLPTLEIPKLEAPTPKTEGFTDAETAAPAAGTKSEYSAMVKISTDRLDALVDAVGELVISNSLVTQRPEFVETDDPKLASDLAQLSKITRELQELAMKMRMVSLKSTFQKMARIARDTSVKAKAPVVFSFSGEDTELDRNVVEEISSPLVHMVRNAVDHGMEPAETRKRAGKPEKGRIHLSAYHEGGAVVIQLSDDGAGINREKVLSKAIKMGLAAADQEMADHEIKNLIFHPGFSTASKVTDLSGRGVGMDVVKKSIENLRGRIDIESEAGAGTTFKIRLPLTLAIIDGMVVRVADEHYIIPTIAIQESLRPEPGQVTTVTKKGEMVSLRGNMSPLFRLHRIFDIEGAKTDPMDALLLMVGGGAGSGCALMVDDLVGQQQVVIKTLGRTFEGLRGISGGAIMGDGKVALILGTAAISSLARNG